MKKMKDKVKKDKVLWFSILSRLDDGKFLPGYTVYLRRIQRRNKSISQNRICYNYFKILFGSTTTAIVRNAIRKGMSYQDMATYFINGRWYFTYPIETNVRRVKVDYELL